MNQALELNRPFNVGDKVISLRYLHLWNDSFHHVHFLNDSLQVVISVTDEFFTFNPVVEIPATFGLDTYAAHHIYLQASGVCVGDDSKTVLSIENDYALIKETLDSALTLALKKIDDEHKNIVVEPATNSCEAGSYLNQLHTKHMQHFGKRDFLYKRFHLVVKHIFAK